jgi:hypothetical protein
MEEKISTRNMSWSDVKAVDWYTANKNENKEKKTHSSAKIILGAIQLTENFIKGIKQLNAYNSSSILKSEATWLQKHSFTEYRDENNKTVDINIGNVCYIDYGKTYQGELSYYHYGLCVGVRDGKILIIPITSGTNWRTECYHPILNPNKNKKFRQALKSEGFSKDCVLKINDAKFLSAGRIDSIDNESEINKEILKEIQFQLFSVCFPEFRDKHKELISDLDKSNKVINDQKEIIKKLKQEKNRLHAIINRQQDSSNRNKK